MKRTIRNVGSILLVVALLAGLAATTAHAAPITFTDVPTGAWYYADVQKAVDTGLINGYPDNTYGPDKNMTYAEAVKLAAVMFLLSSTGSIEFEKGDPWYQPYVDYAKDNGVITKDYDWNAAATRAGYMEIFAKAIPDIPALAGMKGLTKINEIPDGAIPDVPMTHPQAAAIYKLYRAGVLQGSDAQHSCKPNSNIRRSEVAAILTRMMTAGERISFNMGQTEQPTEDKLTVAAQPENLTVKTAENAAFAVTVSGGKEPYKFEWYYSGASETQFARCEDAVDWNMRFEILNDSGRSTLTVLQADVNAKQDGSKYYCVVTDADGATVTSATAVLTVTETFTIAQQPKDQTAELKGEAIFTTSAAGGKEPYTYKWYYRTANMSDFGPCTQRAEAYEWFRGMDGATLTVKALDNSLHECAFCCFVTDADGKQVKTEAAILSVNAPRFTVHPQDVTVEKGADATFSVEVVGGKAPYTYQWQYRLVGSSQFFNCSEKAESLVWFDGIDTATLTVKQPSGVEPLDGSRYQCFVTDADGKTACSEMARYTVAAEPLTINSMSADQTAKKGADVIIAFTFSGGKEPYTSEWYFKNADSTQFSRCKDAAESSERFKSKVIKSINVPDSTICALTIVKAGENMQQNGSQYYCVVTDAAGNTVTTKTITVTLTD